MHTFMQFKSGAKVQKKIDIRKRTRVFLVFYFSCQFFCIGKSGRNGKTFAISAISAMRNFYTWIYIVLYTMYIIQSD